MNCIIIDDEPLARQGMELHLKNIPSLKVLGSFSNAMDANHIIKEETVDIIFLDINMPEINGLDFVKSLLHKPQIIFVTAYPQYALDSYELDAVDYLVKPVRFERLVKAVNKAENNYKLLQPGNKYDSIETIDADFIFIKSDKKFFKVFFKEILFIEGLKDYVTIQLEDKKVVTAMNIKTIGAQLPAGIFTRISKSFIVNMNHIVSFDSFSVYLKNEELPIGDSYKDDFMSNYVTGKILKR
jgi:DNA-binding LytR/AlgR family response regulator